MQNQIFLEAPERGLKPSVLRSEIEKIYYDIDAGRYKGEANIIADRSAMAISISLGGAVVGFENSSDVFCVRDWNQVIPWLNRGQKNNYNIKNLQRVEFRRGGMPIDGDFFLISERYKGHPVYHNHGILLDDEIAPFCPLWIYAPMAEVDFISDYYYVTSYDRGNVSRCRNSKVTIYDARITLNRMVVSTDPEFDKKNPTNDAVSSGIGLAGTLVLPPPFNFFAGGFTVYKGIKYVLNKRDKNKNLIEMSTGAFNMSFCGNLAKRPLELPLGA